MWANVQRDGRPAKHRWPPLFNAAVWLTLTTWLPCSNAANSWNPLKLAGMPQTRQQISAVSGPKFSKDMWGRYRCLTSFFRLSIRTSVAKIWPDKVVWWCRDGNFLHSAFPESRVQHVSDLHPKFALRPHHVWKYGRHPICDGWD